ncbi:MAG: hypothetical protein IPF93_22225, partial [Saprospiraceae bacterium]|nr:hypothetical protein [Saprospiraceae bacterium]
LHQRTPTRSSNHHRFDLWNSGSTGIGASFASQLTSGLARNTTSKSLLCLTITFWIAVLHGLPLVCHRPGALDPAFATTIDATRHPSLFKTTIL